MTEDKYVRKVINEKKAKSISIFDQRLTHVKNVVRKWAGTSLKELKKSGSSAKDTAVKGVADFDLFISLTSNVTNPLSEIYNSLDSHVKDNGYITRRQNVSIRVKCSDLSVDLVPGRVHKGYVNYHSLYTSKKDSWLQTNVDLHINSVVVSGRQEEIIALKIWREIHSLSFPSIYLERTVLHALKYKNKNQPAKNFLTILEFLRDDFVSSTVIDPANSNNVISDLLYKNEKEKIQKKARECLNQNSWDSILW